MVTPLQGTTAVSSVERVVVDNTKQNRALFLAALENAFRARYGKDYAGFFDRETGIDFSDAALDRQGRTIRFRNRVTLYEPPMSRVISRPYPVAGIATFARGGPVTIEFTDAPEGARTGPSPGWLDVDLLVGG